MSGSCTSSRTRSGFSSFTACRAAAPVSASPTISYPSASRSVRALARKLGWSSTIRTVMPTVSSHDPAFRIRLPTLFLDARPSFFAPVLPRFGLGSRRNLHVEDGALRAVRLDPDSPMHAPDELARDVEAQTGASDPPGHVRVEPVELLEDPALLRGWDAEPLIGDGEAHVLAGSLKADVDVPARRRILDGIVEEVGHDLAQLA